MNIQEFYDSIDLQFIERSVSEQTIETDVLDFKEASRQSGPMQKDDLKNFAKALSGFANSSGGILIWGVKASKTKEGVDAAQELKPIRNLKRFLTDLNSLSPQVVSPFLLGVTHKLIYQSEENDEGYIASFIPEGGSEPNMALASEQQRYYCRANSNFMPMTHTMVADRFNRIAKPELWTCLTYLSNVAPIREVGGATNRIMIGLANFGAGAAHYPAVSFGPRFSTNLVPLLASKLNGIKILIPGDHDKCWQKTDPSNRWFAHYINAGFQSIQQTMTLEIAGHTVLLNHLPYHNVTEPAQRYFELRPVDHGGWLIHGHIYQHWKVNGKQINVSVDAWNFNPVSIKIIENGPVMDEDAKSMQSSGH